MSSPKLKIAIVGGGIGGLSLAVAIKTSSKSSSSNGAMEIHVFEKSSDFIPMAGAGMSVWPRTVSIFRKWGIASEFKDIVTQSPIPNMAFEMRQSNQPKSTTPFYNWKLPGGLHSFHRAHLLDLLASTACSGTNTHIHFNSEFLSYSPTPNGGVTLHLTNGKSYNFDLLIACDGLWSNVRVQMYKEISLLTNVSPKSDSDDEINPIPQWTGTVVFRALIAHSALLNSNPNHSALRAPQMYCGHNLRIICYLMNRRQLLNFVAFVSKPSLEGTSYESAWKWQTEDMINKKYLEELFGRWEPEVRELINLIPDKRGLPGLMRMPIFALEPLPRFVHGRVVLLGDAAHATTPHWGFGACSSIEDANILATLLTRSTRSTLNQALAVYDKLRVAEGRRIILGSRQMGFMYEFNGPSTLKNDLNALAREIEKRTSWIGGANPEDDVKRALDMLKSLSGKIQVAKR